MGVLYIETPSGPDVFVWNGCVDCLLVIGTSVDDDIVRSVASKLPVDFGFG